jgi:serine/threonine-protein kinase
LCWTASEWIEGEDAAQLIHRIGIAGMLDWRKSLKVAIHITRALDFASQHQIVHRNMAPRHILVRKRDGVVKLGGLGLAKSLNEDASAKVTKAGEIVGNFSYCSPEQVNGKVLDARSDLYNLGATVYALLTGKPPCEGQSFVETLDNVRNQIPEPPTKSHLSVPALFEGIVMRLLEKRPDNRYADAKALLVDLHRAAMYLGETGLLNNE